MTRRQTLPQQWLVADRRLSDALWATLRGLPRGSGVLVLRELSPAERRRLRELARPRSLTVVFEASGTAARVHDMGELRSALLRRTPLILISPLHETRSHPGWRAMPRMRAAALARLAGRKAIALGGMNPHRFRRFRDLGFVGWAAIDAWSKP